MAAVNITDMNASGGIVSVNHLQNGLSLHKTPTILIVSCGHILWYRPCSVFSKVKRPCFFVDERSLRTYFVVLLIPSIFVSAIPNMYSH